VEEKGTGVAELLGQHRYQLDNKGRIALPAKFREAFAGGLYLTLGQDGCLFAFPKDEWERRSEEVRTRPLAGQEARAYARMFFGNADRADRINFSSYTPAQTAQSTSSNRIMKSHTSAASSGCGNSLTQLTIR